MKNILSSFVIFLVISIITSCTNSSKVPCIYLDNSKLVLGFDKQTGSMHIFRDLTNAYDYIDENLTSCSPWQIDLAGDRTPESIDINSARKFSYSRPDPLTVKLVWQDFSGARNSNLQVSATIALEKNRPISSWKISLQGINAKQVDQVLFPRIASIKDLGNEKLAVPQWMGQILDNPRTHLSSIQGNNKKYEWTYPGVFSLQCLALYNPDKCGLYAACDDSLAFIKDFSISLDSLNSVTYQMHNYPSLDSTLTSYAPPYSAIIGSFKGDWITAAEIYREWGTKQRWCRESRFKNKLTSPWLENTALWVWNRSKSANVLVPATDLQQRLGLPVSVFWHWWHGCPYDHGFPEYIPPREGKSSFISALSSAQEKGIHAIVYMNQVLWGTSTKSWQEEKAAPYAAKNSAGQTRSHVFNIFTKQPLAYMCMATQYWRDKYASLCDSAVNRYKTNGVYMDMACLSLKCYDKNHGHPVGGGNYWVENFGKLTGQIRAKIASANQPVLAGEGCGEAWLPYLDVFLTLAVSKERYAGPGLWETIPFFQAVYHQYGITYGNYSSLLVPPYDELWPKEFAPKRPLALLNRDFNQQFLMEQARSFVWGMQPTIANYQPFLAADRKTEIDYLMNLAQARNRGLKYLLHGKFVKCPKIESPELEFAISRLSIYAGKKGESVTSFRKKYPLLYSAAWQADDGDIAIALASISDDPVPIHCSFPAEEYGLGSVGRVRIIDQQGKRELTRYADKIVKVDFIMQAREVCLVEISSF